MIGAIGTSGTHTAANGISLQQLDPPGSRSTTQTLTGRTVRPSSKTGANKSDARNRNGAAERPIQLPTPKAAADATTVASHGQFGPAIGQHSGPHGAWQSPANAPRMPHALLSLSRPCFLSYGFLPCALPPAPGRMRSFAPIGASAAPLLVLQLFVFPQTNIRVAVNTRKLTTPHSHSHTHTGSPPLSSTYDNSQHWTRLAFFSRTRGTHSARTSLHQPARRNSPNEGGSIGCGRPKG